MSDMKFWQPPNEVMAVDVSGLAGIKLWYETYTGELYTSIVAGVDHYVGVSLVQESDHTEICYCLYGPMAPRAREQYLVNEHWQEVYPKMFITMVSYLRECVAEGKPFSYNEYQMRAVGETGNGCGYSGCPYGV